MNTQDPRFPLFDSLRAVAALSVLGYHVWLVSGASQGALAPYVAQLDAGVPVFFLVSGFLLYRPFARARFHAEPAPAVVPYAIRRIARIVPAYWVALVVVAIWFGVTAVASLPRGLLYFGFAQSYDRQALFDLPQLRQAWTLCVEVSFYALLPVWAAVLRRLRFTSTSAFGVSELGPLALVFVASIAWRLTVVHIGDGGFAQATPGLLTLPSQLDHFALGMGLAVVSVMLSARAGPSRAERRLQAAPWAAWVLAAAAFGLTGWLAKHSGSRWDDLRQHELKGAFALALILPAVFGGDRRDPVRAILRNRVLLWCGLVSYGIYLWHLPVLYALHDAGLDDSAGLVPFAATALTVTVALAAISYYGLERHALRAGRRLAAALSAGRRDSSARGPQSTGRTDKAADAPVVRGP